jgi:integrase
MTRPIKHYDKWRIRLVDAQGKRRSETFDTFAAAQRRLNELLVEKDEICAGRRAPIDHDKTFDELCDYWMQRRAPKKRSAKDDESIIRAHLRPFFGSSLLRMIGTERIDAYATEKGHLSQKTVANHLTLLKTMMNLAVDLGWLGRTPKVHKPRIPLFSADYQYLRTHEEIDRFLGAARHEGVLAHALYTVAVYTGLRAGELGGLHWADVDLDRRLLTVQRSFDGPTKAGDVRYVPILDPLLPVLREWRLAHPGQHVFTNRDGRPLQPSGRIYQEVFHRVLNRAGFPPIKVGGKELPYITFHDLRHTFASQWVANGGDIFKLQKILGHKSIQMTMRYAHLAPHAFVADYARLGEAKSSEQAVVLPLRTIAT